MMRHFWGNLVCGDLVFLFLLMGFATLPAAAQGPAALMMEKPAAPEEKKEEEHAEEEHTTEQEEHEEQADIDSECDEAIGELVSAVEQLTAENARLTTELTELRGRYDEHHTRHHDTSEEHTEQLPEPEPVPEERHAWFRPIGKR